MSARRGHNEGSITKRSDGLWEARITLDGGKRKSFYAKTRQEAAKKLTAALRDVEMGLPIAADKLSVERYFTDWLAAVKSTIRPRTWKRYEQYIRVHLLPTLGRVALAKLSAQHLQLLYAKKLEEGLSSTSVHHTHTVIHKALEGALRLGLIQRNVSDLVDPPRMRHHEMTTLSEQQARTLIGATHGIRHEALYVVALATGMRLGELLALKWRDIDLERATLNVRATLQRTPDGLILAEPKTAYSRRTIALSRTAVAAFRQHHARQQEERLRIGETWHDMDLIFANEIGRPLEAGNVLRRSFWPLLKRAGLPHMRFHDLRHTAATLLLGRGINPKVVSEMLGHSHISITLGLYSHVTPHMQQQAADAMDAALGDM
jgi:integrase